MNTTPRPFAQSGHLRPDVALAAVMTLVGSCWLAWLSLRTGALTSQQAVGHAALSTALVSAPETLLAVPVTLALLRDRGTEQRISATSHVVASSLVAAATLSGGNQLHALFAGAAPSQLAVFALVGDALSLLTVLLPTAALAALVTRHRGAPRGTRRSRRVLAAVITAAVAAAASLAASPAQASSPPSGCLSGGAADKTFDVTALDVNIPVNRFGDHDPKGKMYALTSRVTAIRDEERSQQVSIGLRDDAIQPLVVRANEGDCVEVSFLNSASGGAFGLHVDGLEFTTSSSGDAVGANPSSAVAQGARTTYRFAIPDDPRMEGAHYIHPGPGYRSAVDHGLFGALVVEPPGSTYWNASVAGQPLESGWEAIIKPLGVNASCDPGSHTASCGFREAALLHHEIGNDNESLTDKTGHAVPQVDELTGSYRPGGFALNYRSEPFRNRLLAFRQEKSHAYSSYTFGDPATPMPRGYLSDPTKIRLLHAGGEKFHIYHLHGGGDRWRYNPVADTTYNYADTGLRKDPATELSPSQRLDSQAIGPGESYNLEIEGGAGGVQQSSGDFLFHCHIAKHYVSGMWSFWRVYSTLQPDLVPLADRPVPAAGVEAADLIGRKFNGVTITAENLDAFVRPQLPPAGVPRDGQDATVWDWKVSGTLDAPLYLGAPADPTLFADSAKVVPGQPNLLAVDAGNLVGTRPKILFDPTNGRPAYPLFRPHIGQRPPFTPSGHTGAPWLGNNTDQAPTNSADPWANRQDGLCPKGRTLRTFNVVAITKPIQRTPSVVDPDGKIFVLAHDKADVYANRKPSDPLAIRANQGDCVAVTLTNEIPNASAFDGVSKTTMHIHHVQFDVQGSDGVSAGFAYEHSVRPYKQYDYTLTEAAAAGSSTLRLSNVDKFVGTDANGNPTHPFIAVGEGTEGIDIVQVASIDRATNTATLVEPLANSHAVGENVGSEFIQYRWYPDVVLDNIFWHDHVDGIHGWGHGLVGQLIVEPAGSTYHDPATGKEVDSGTLVDIHTSQAVAPGWVGGSFRELALWTIDDNDRSDYSTLNLRATPLSARGDSANRFSSYKYGDPNTPLPKLYPNDPLVVRTVNVSPTVDTLHFQGARTLLEPRYRHDGTPDGSVIDTIHYGVSEKFTLIFNGQQESQRVRPGDYLYGNGLDYRMQQGAWGLVRVLPGLVPTLQPLPSVNTPTNTYTPPTTTGQAPPNGTGPGSPCQPGAPSRQFAVSAMDVPGQNNGARAAYVPNADVSAVRSGAKKAEPLVLHVVAGECVTVHVSNLRSTTVGFSVSKLDREAGSGGVNIGFSSQQNIAPQGTRDFVYWVQSDRLGMASISDLTGSGTMKQGMYGAVVVAPASTVSGQVTTFTDPVSGQPRDIGPQVLVHVPGAEVPHYRDFSVIMADDDAAIGQDFMPYPTNATTGRSLVNYQAAPAGDGPTAFRNPGSVPWLTALAGDPVVVHAMVSPGSENAHVFTLGGLRWSEDDFVANSNWTTAQGMGPWETFTATIVGGAGGSQQASGDYFYGDARKPFTQVGLWGLQRVLPAESTGCAIRRVDNSPC
ncbi:MAG: multicopper oxidase domain-containing protein [Pedococcus sp.]